MGTLHYSSPEQIEGRWVDGRSDQYGLACLVFRALTGQVPYPRPETAAVIYAHLAADPPRPSLHRRRPAARGGRRRGPGHREAARAAVPELHGLHRRAAARPCSRAPRPGPDDRCPRRCRCRSRPRSPKPPRRTRRPTGPPPGAAAPRRRGRPAAARPDSAVPQPRTAPATVPGRHPTPSPRRRTCGPSAAPTTGRSRSPGRRRAARDVEYKVTRLAADGRRHVVGRTRATYLVDGAVAPDSPSRRTRSSPGSGRRPPRRSAPPRRADPGGIPAVRDLTVSPGGALEFDWPDGRHRGDGGGPRRPAARGARRPGRRQPGRSPTCATSSTAVSCCPSRWRCPATSPWRPAGGRRHPRRGARFRRDRARHRRCRANARAAAGPRPPARASPGSTAGRS